MQWPPTGGELAARELLADLSAVSLASKEDIAGFNQVIASNPAQRMESCHQDLDTACDKVGRRLMSRDRVIGGISRTSLNFNVSSKEPDG
jgi:hypothetical protein